MDRFIVVYECVCVHARACALALKNGVVSGKEDFFLLLFYSEMVVVSNLVSPS